MPRQMPPKMTSDMTITRGFAIRFPSGRTMELPMIKPSDLPPNEKICKACRIPWTEKSRVEDVLELPFVLQPCMHILGSICLAKGLDEDEPCCLFCNAPVEVEVCTPRILVEEVEEASETSEEDESVQPNELSQKGNDDDNRLNNPSGQSQPDHISIYSISDDTDAVSSTSSLGERSMSGLSIRSDEGEDEEEEREVAKEEEEEEAYVTAPGSPADQPSEPIRKGNRFTPAHQSSKPIPKKKQYTSDEMLAALLMVEMHGDTTIHGVVLHNALPILDIAALGQDVYTVKELIEIAETVRC